MVEYYKTQKGYCYKKTQKGGSKRISNKDYQKKTKLKGGDAPIQILQLKPILSQQQVKKPRVQNVGVEQIWTDVIKEEKPDLNALMNIVNLKTDENVINSLIKKFCSSSNVSKQSAGKRIKRKKKNQKGGGLLKDMALQCFGVDMTPELELAVQPVVPHITANPPQLPPFPDLNINANLRQEDFEMLSDDIRPIPHYNHREQMRLVKRCLQKQKKAQAQEVQMPQDETTKQIIISIIIAAVVAVSKAQMNEKFKDGDNYTAAFACLVFLVATLTLKKYHSDIARGN